MKLELDLEQNDPDLLLIQAEAIRRIAVRMGGREAPATETKRAPRSAEPVRKIPLTAAPAHEVYPYASVETPWFAALVDGNGYCYGPKWFKTEDAVNRFAKAHTDDVVLVGRINIT